MAKVFTYRTEELSKQYLEELNLGDVLYEPDGNIPPDFVIDGRIAVEVTRLNQHFEDGNSTTGLEQEQAALIRYIERLLPTLGPSIEGKGYWMSFDFRRPLDLKDVKKALPVALEKFRRAPTHENFIAKPSKGFRIDIFPAGIPREHFYSFAGYNDLDSGGFVVSEMIRNLKLCMAKKAAKVAPYRDRYPVWWLLLVDHISSPGLDHDERASLRKYVSPGDWDRVILLNSMNTSLVFDL